MADYPPSGFDRCDGQSGRPGTATPSGSLIVKPFASYIEEMASSPEIERAEQATIRHSYKCDWVTGLTIIQAYGRGVFLEDSNGNRTRVLSSTLASANGDSAVVTITAEGINFDSPPDHFAVNDVELNLPLSQHPRYIPVVHYNMDSLGATVDPTQLTGDDIMMTIDKVLALPQTSAQQDHQFILNTSNVTDPDALGLALELLQKKRRGEETWYLAGIEVSWSQYFWLPPLRDPGGYRQDPVDGGLPSYFWSDDGTPTGHNIFTDLAVDVNPQIWGDGIVWLRKGDEIQYDRTWFQKTVKWLGAPKGNGPDWTAAWDADIYPLPP